ncbi:MAG: sulfatase, partial [Planctomycetes bacterium]|nr:sulfatase [Planctomycetota bacterium]
MSYRLDNALLLPDSMWLARRAFLGRPSLGLGALSLRSLAADGVAGRGGEAVASGPHFAPRARRVVYLFQAGGPSPFETFD